MTRKIIFGHGRAVGDALMFTSGVRDFKLLFPEIEVGVETNFPQLWDNNPYITKLDKNADDVEFYKVGYPIINNANAASTHFTQGFLLDMIAIADAHKSLPLGIGEFAAAFANGSIGDPELWKEEDANPVLKEIKEKYKGFCDLFGRIRADIHLSEQEKRNNLIKKIYGVDHYWVVAPGGKRDCTCKIWDWRRFQEVIDYFDRRIKFVVIGKSDHIVEKLDRVIDLTDKFNNNLRGIMSLVYHSKGTVSGISFLHHLSAAMPDPKRTKVYPRPSITIYGGREPQTFTNYNQTYPLHTSGTLYCCDYGGCWQSRVVPLAKDNNNTRMCHQTVVRDGRTIPLCMDMITADDVIRTIERIYRGNIFNYSNPVTHPSAPTRPDDFIDEGPHPIRLVTKNEGKEINVLASLQSKGGGEQSAVKIVELLRGAGWKVNFYPWDKVHQNYKEVDIKSTSFKSQQLHLHMKPGLPLFFYANDQIWDFCSNASKIVEQSSQVIVGINFANGTLPTCEPWLKDKLTAVIFQNEEKRSEFDRDAIGMDHVERIVLFGAIDLDRYLEVYAKPRVDGGPLVILKHGLPDWRKYVTEESKGTGEKIHIWQKHFYKETDTNFYTRLLKDIPDIKFMFMEAHPEVEKYFKGEDRMTFYKFNQIPVDEFLSKGHVYLHRMSNAWRDNYPRVVAEALAAGLPVVSEPRDGTKDRIVHGNTGFYATHYDEFCIHLKTFKRKEGLRRAMGQAAKDWARLNLDPRKWVEVIERTTHREEQACLCKADKQISA